MSQAWISHIESKVALVSTLTHTNTRPNHQCSHRGLMNKVWKSTTSLGVIISLHPMFMFVSPPVSQQFLPQAVFHNSVLQNPWFLQYSSIISSLLQTCCFNLFPRRTKKSPLQCSSHRKKKAKRQITTYKEGGKARERHFQVDISALKGWFDPCFIVICKCNWSSALLGCRLLIVFHLFLYFLGSSHLVFICSFHAGYMRVTLQTEGEGGSNHLQIASHAPIHPPPHSTNQYSALPLFLFLLTPFSSSSLPTHSILSRSSISHSTTAA